MAAEIETMFYTREKPWHGLGVRVAEAPNSADALQLAGLDWEVRKEPIYSADGSCIPGYKANIRDTDQKVLGVVTDRYKVIQNTEAFAFTDALLGEGVRYETAGSLQGGRISPYLVFSNTHDGSGSVKVAITPIRVVCNNTLNLALANAKRSFSMIHTGDIAEKMQEAKDTLFMANTYMEQLGREFEMLRAKKLSDARVEEFIKELLPVGDASSVQQYRNVRKLREGMRQRYFDAPDLKEVGKNAYRFVNAVSDFATHAEPLRKTASYKENLFGRTVDGNPLIDKAYQMVCAA